MSSILWRALLGFATISTLIGTMCMAVVALFDGARWFRMDSWWPDLKQMEDTGHACIFAGVLGLFLGFGGWEHGRVRSRQRIRTGHCGECSYDRRGTHLAAPCPECGEPAPVATKGKSGGIWPLVLIAALFLAARALMGPRSGGGIC